MHNTLSLTQTQCRRLKKNVKQQHANSKVPPEMREDDLSLRWPEGERVRVRVRARVREREDVWGYNRQICVANSDT